jgi:IS5 family transposase
MRWLLIRMLRETPVGSRTKATALYQEIEHFTGMVAQVVEQTERRVFEEENVAASEKLVSIFEPHTAIIRRGRTAKSTEFGRKVWLSEAEGGIVSSYRILSGNPNDSGQIEPELLHHIRVFGRPPQLLAADRGCDSPDNERLAEELGVRRVCLPQRGRKTEERRKHERQRWFRRAQRFRARSEGRISVLKRHGHLGRCRDRGEEGFGRWVGWGILTANLGTIARHLA